MTRQCALPMVVSTCVTCTTVMFVLSAVSHLEFHYAEWSQDTTGCVSFPPWITDHYHTVYTFGWGIPALAAVWGLVLLTLDRCHCVAMAWYVCIIGVILVFWVCFALVSLYLANQTFVVR
jgi:hypothetical protein